MSTADAVVDRPETLKQVAERTGLNYWWLRRACTHREIVFTKDGRNYCLTAEQVEAAMKARYRTVGTQADDDITRENERRAQSPRRRRVTPRAA